MHQQTQRGFIVFLFSTTFSHLLVTFLGYRCTMALTNMHSDLRSNPSSALCFNFILIIYVNPLSRILGCNKFWLNNAIKVLHLVYSNSYHKINVSAWRPNNETNCNVLFLVFKLWQFGKRTVFCQYFQFSGTSIRTQIINISVDLKW